MPQPFRPDGAHEFMLSMDALAMRPTFAAHVGVIAGMWSYIEATMADLVSTILLADALVGATIYGVIKAEAARFAAIDAIAMERLSQLDFDKYTELKKAVRSVGGQRDQLLHNLWVLPPKGTDGILLIDSRKHAFVNAASRSFTARDLERITAEEISMHNRAFETHGDRFNLYVEDDFLRIERDIRQLGTALTSFVLKLQIRSLAPIRGPLQLAAERPMKKARKTKASRPPSA